MTKAITLPILGVGAMAIKSAADLEKMEVSFISLTGGAKQAADMMEQLNEFTAKTPFQIEAVATSARQLIASGTKISEVNEQLQFLGDIAATTGQPINEIAAIFAKVNAKGKVELENLNQLAERGIPIFKALSDATGLLPSELGAGAVSVEQFNATLKSFNEEGGLAEGAMDKLSQTASGKFSTALDNLKLAGAALAEDLLPIVNKLLDKIVELAQKFTGLSDSAKKNILVIGGLLAVVGPLLVAIPKLIAGIQATRTAWIALNAAMLLNPIYLVTAAIVALGVVMVATSGNIKKSREETDKYILSLKGLERQAQLNALNEQIRIKQKEARDLAAAKKASEAAIAAGALGDKFDRSVSSGNVLKYGAQLDAVSESIKILKEEVDRIHSIDLGADSGIKDKGGLIEVVTPEQMELLDALPPKLIAVKKPIQELQESTNLLTESLQFTTTAFDNLGQQIGDVFANAIVDGENFVDSLAAMGKAILKTLISEAIAHAITNAASSKNLANQASGGLTIPAFIAAAVGSVKMAFSDVPQLAEGGLAYGRSLVEVGEYSGAGGNPEVIAPLNKLKDMLGGNAIQVYGRISGDDIVISNNRASRDRNRF
jgi:tape measure domain-containing protein